MKQRFNALDLRSALFELKEKYLFSLIQSKGKHFVQIFH
jgi:hypothetical protein